MIDYKICILIPTYNRVEKTIRCLESLLISDIKKYQTKIIVVDSSSSDGTKEILSKSYKDLEILTIPSENLWTGTINFGLEFINKNYNYDYILILNNDCIVDKNFIDDLIKSELANHPSVVSPLIMTLSNKKMIRFGPAAWNTLRLGWNYPYAGQPIKNLDQTIFHVPLLNGNCCLLPREILKALGKYDDHNFPHCYADAVYTIRVLRAGYPLIMSTNSIVYDDDSDIKEKLIGNNDDIFKLLKSNFIDKKSPYYYRGFIIFYIFYAENMFKGLLVLTIRSFRIIVKIILSILNIRKFYING